MMIILFLLSVLWSLGSGIVLSISPVVSPDSAIVGSILPSAPPIAQITQPVCSDRDDSGIDVSDKLWWSPPPLTDPITIKVVPIPYRRGISLEPGQDYIIEMPDQPVQEGLIIGGGRNIVMMGGEISLPWQGEEAYISERTGLKIVGATGTVHIEGLLIRGSDLSEGIQIDAPEAIVQIQNVRIEDVHARDEVNFSDNHPDLIQTYGGAVELRVDKFTGSSDYQGFFFKSDVPHGYVDVRRVNIKGSPTARYLMWFELQAWSGDVFLWDVWIDVPEERPGGLGRAVWPPATADDPFAAKIISQDSTEIALWPTMSEPCITGYISEGSPPGGDFVGSDEVGIGYVSPGYQDE